MSRPICALLVCALGASVYGAPPVYTAVFGGSGQDAALAVTSDAEGNTYIAGLTYSPDFPVTPHALQTNFGQTSDAFVTKLSRGGKVIWSTYLGGILDDAATTIALDASGNVWVAGYTRSPNFPVVNPIQPVDNEGASDDFDAFVAEIDPTGSRLLFSTFLGGQGDDGAAGLAVDSRGNVYVAVNSTSAAGYPGTQNLAAAGGIFITKLMAHGALVYSYFHANGDAGGIALDAAGNVYVAGWRDDSSVAESTKIFGPRGNRYAMAFKIAADGSRKLYDVAIGGSVQARATAIAVSDAGEAYIAGDTSSADIPLLHPLQKTLGARPVWKSTDGGQTFRPLEDLPFAIPNAIVPDPTGGTVYAATQDMGVLRSLDGGVTWSKVSNGIASVNGAGVDVQALVIDTLDPRALYAATATTVYKSTDGANSWAAIDSPGAPVQLILDSRNRIIYEVSSGIRKSADGGLSWTPVSFPGAVSTVAIDPNASGHLFAISTPMFCGPTCPNNQAAISYRTIDGGATWIAAPVAPSSPPRLIVDASTNPSTIYDGLVAKSVDGGQTWSPIANPFRNSVINTMAVDSAGNVYVDIAGSGLFVSHDRAQTWTAVGYPGGPGITGANGIGLKSIAPASPNTLYVTANQQAAAGFVSKLSADGSTLEFSTYLRGHASLESFPQVAGEPAGMLLQNEISGVALDGAGDIVVAGVTRAADFPTVNAAQAINAGMADAFAAVIPADGGKLGYATYFGGSQDDGALAMAVDSQGNIIIAGQTWSGDRGAGAAAPGFGDAFAAKLSTAAPIVQRHRRR